MPRFASYVICAAAAAMIFVSASAVTARAAEPAGTENVDPASRPVIQLQYEGPIKVVYQVSRDEYKEGVSKPLLYLKKLRGYYAQQGYDAEDLEIRAVFHGSASTHVLTDEAYNRVKGTDNGNPSTQLLSELADLGVKVELCDVRRQREGWAKADIHPDVLLASAAYARIIDLQHQGYAYIRF